MKSIIQLYEERKVMLLKHQEEAVLGLAFIQEGITQMDKETREVMAEMMDYVSYLNDLISLLDNRIKRINKNNLNKDKA